MKKTMTKLFKSCFVAISCIVAFLLLFIVLFEALAALDAFVAKNEVKKYSATEETYIFIGDVDVNVTKTIKETLLKMPDQVEEEIRDNWVILVSNNNPMISYDVSFAVGYTHARAKLIWLAPDFTEETLIHEIGHAIASVEHIDISKNFRRLYKTFLYNVDCTDWIGENFDSHDTSTSGEFFAFLFVQYMNNADLEAHFKDGYVYMSNAVNSLNQSWTNVFTRHYNLLSYIICAVSNPMRSILSVWDVYFEVRNNPTIQMSDYQEQVVFAGLTEKENVILDMIFDVVKNIDNYKEEIGSGSSVMVLEHNEQITYETYNKIVACIDCYLGCENSEVIDIVNNSASDTAYIYIHIDELERLKERRAVYVDNTSKALETMHEGTETQKLLQISKYIVNNCKYADIGNTTADDFWTDGVGGCLTYAMVFRQFCEQLGIQCDVICGKNKSGETHMWNRVKLSDGSYRYYDLPYYRVGAVDVEQYDRHTVLIVNGYYPW